MSKKIKIIILIVVAVLVLAVVGVFILINSKSYKEKLIASELRTMTEEFYGFYYDDQNTDSKAKEFVAQFKDTGLSISLGDMKIYLEGRTNKKYDSKRLEKCDVAKTTSIMYPKSPFGKNDVDIKFEISCK
jgi:hypothetical protein